MIEVIRQDDEVFRYASKNLRMDPSFNLEAIRLIKKFTKKIISIIMSFLEKCRLII